jgi:hypothetical protein
MSDSRDRSVMVGLSLCPNISFAGLDCLSEYMPSEWRQQTAPEYASVQFSVHMDLLWTAVPSANGAGSFHGSHVSNAPASQGFARVRAGRGRTHVRCCPVSLLFPPQQAGQYIDPVACGLRTTVYFCTEWASDFPWPSPLHILRNVRSPTQKI